MFADFYNAAQKGHNILAQGFSPGNTAPIRCALKAAPDRIRAALCFDELEVPNRGWCPFRTGHINISYPGLKPWANMLCPFGAKDEDGLPRRSLRRREDEIGGAGHP
jgi:hypothetical protein